MNRLCPSGSNVGPGRYDPTVGVLQRLAKALGVPVTEFLG